MASLQAAFKEAIQQYFQLEPRELSCEPMPDRHDRHEILFYEASEGGAGVLRQIVVDPLVLPKLARIALEICHYNPATLDDLGALTCGKACYECLLEYSNQLDHKDLDRNLVRDILANLMRTEVVPAGGAGSRAERMSALRKQCDSELEKRWLDMVDKLMLRPPSDAQFFIEAFSTRPDFYYREYNAAIYVDGPPHDEPDKIKEDEEITRKLRSVGYAVIRFHHKANWEAIFQNHADIFGSPVGSGSDKQELAVVTLKFAKPNSEDFTRDDQARCRTEGDAAIESLLRAIKLPADQTLKLQYIGDGSSTYWYEVALVVTLVAGAPYVMHQVGEVLQQGGNLAARLAILMTMTGAWLKSAAWRLSPKNPHSDMNPKPGCFGQKDQLDRRYKRCRDCGFLSKCTQTIEASQNNE